VPRASLGSSSASGPGWTRSGTADVAIGGHDDLQQATRWCLFQLAQAPARADGQGVPAKGVSGSGYSGHYFWDTEIYVLRSSCTRPRSGLATRCGCATSCCRPRVVGPLSSTRRGPLPVAHDQR
jgi:hypothetical protein